MPGPGSINFREVPQGTESDLHGILESSLNIDVGSGDLDVRLSDRGPGRAPLWIVGGCDLIKLARLFSRLTGVVEKPCFGVHESTAREVMRAFGDVDPLEQVKSRCEDVDGGVGLRVPLEIGESTRRAKLEFGTKRRHVLTDPLCQLDGIGGSILVITDVVNEA